jgi:hypothetical protein
MPRAWNSNETSAPLSDPGTFEDIEFQQIGEQRVPTDFEDLSHSHNGDIEAQANWRKPLMTKRLLIIIFSSLLCLATLIVAALVDIK